MARWFVGQEDSQGRLTGTGFDDQEQAYTACSAFNKGFRKFPGAQDPGENPYKVYDLSDKDPSEEDSEGSQ